MNSALTVLNQGCAGGVGGRGDGVESRRCHFVNISVFPFKPLLRGVSTLFLLNTTSHALSFITIFSSNKTEQRLLEVSLVPRCKCMI